MDFKDGDENSIDGVAWIYQDPPGTWVVKDVHGPLAERPFDEDVSFDYYSNDTKDEMSGERGLFDENQP